MKKIKSLFLLFALVATSCIIGIGISVAERSIIGIISCIIVVYTSDGNRIYHKEKNEGKWFSLTSFLHLKSESLSSN